MVWYLIVALGTTQLAVLPHEFASEATCEASAEYFRKAERAWAAPTPNAFCIPALVGTTEDEGGS